MKKIESLIKNRILIFKDSLSYCTYLITVVGFGITISNSDIKLDFYCVLMVYTALFSSSLIGVIIKYLVTGSNTVFKSGTKSINVIYGDLFEIAFRKDSHKSIVVVPVNTAFDTIVDDRISNIDKPLVSPNTIHGQWVKRIQDCGLNIDELDRRIATDLLERHIYPIERLTREQKMRGNLKCFERGTVAVVDYKNTTFFLFALSVFDANNNAQCSRDEFIEAMQKLLLFCDHNSNGKDIYIPLMGTNLSRANMNHEQSLQSLVALCKLYEDKIHNAVNIVIYEGDRDKVSIYDAK